MGNVQGIEEQKEKKKEKDKTHPAVTKIGKASDKKKIPLLFPKSHIKGRKNHKKEKKEKQKNGPWRKRESRFYLHEEIGMEGTITGKEEN